MGAPRVRHTRPAPANGAPAFSEPERPRRRHVLTGALRVQVSTHGPLLAAAPGAAPGAEGAEGSAPTGQPALARALDEVEKPVTVRLVVGRRDETDAVELLTPEGEHVVARAARHSAARTTTEGSRLRRLRPTRVGFADRLQHPGMLQPSVTGHPGQLQHGLSGPFLLVTALTGQSDSWDTQSPRTRCPGARPCLRARPMTAGIQA